MKAKQQAAEAEKAAKDGGEDDASLTSEEPQSRAEPQPVVVFDGGFFQVESPGRPPSGERRTTNCQSPCCSCHQLFAYVIIIIIMMSSYCRICRFEEIQPPECRCAASGLSLPQLPLT